MKNLIAGATAIMTEVSSHCTQGLFFGFVILVLALFPSSFLVRFQSLRGLLFFLSRKYIALIYHPNTNNTPNRMLRTMDDLFSELSVHGAQLWIRSTPCISYCLLIPLFRIVCGYCDRAQRLGPRCGVRLLRPTRCHGIKVSACFLF